jgi:DNA invertase Pin-like site-specific DNA recombinase
VALLSPFLNLKTAQVLVNTRVTACHPHKGCHLQYVAASGLYLRVASMQADSETRAVVYLRRSTDRQDRSLDDQMTAIQVYARTRGCRILQIYTDDAISGVRSDTRPAFQQLLRDAQQPGCGFNVVLVYDLKRFGRVDNDEAGHYRWLLRQSGVQIIYVAESFGGGPLDDLIRPVKQWQAREESRDLARVTIRGLLGKIKQDQKHGLWLGGFPPYGYDLRYETSNGNFRFIIRYMRDGSKQMLSSAGQLVGILKRRESAITMKSDRCRLVFSAPERVEIVREIYDLFLGRNMKPSAITQSFNERGIPTARSPDWSRVCSGIWRTITIQNILQNPAYAGDLVWNRRTLAKFFRIGRDGILEERLDAHTRRTAANGIDVWIRSADAHPAIIERTMWNMAQTLLSNSK